MNTIYLLLVALFISWAALSWVVRRMKEAEFDRDLNWMWAQSWKRVARNLQRRIDGNIAPGADSPAFESWVNGDGALLLESLIAEDDDSPIGGRND